MKNRMKKYIYILLTTVLITGCTDFLERSNPENAANDYLTKGDIEAQKIVDAVYATTQIDAMYSRFLVMLCNVRSDEGCLTPNAAKMEENFITLANYNSDAVEKYTTSLWQNLYIGIMRANYTIENVPLMGNASQSVKTRILGEAFFLRALFNFHLVMLYGEAVPVKNSLSLSQAQFEQGPGSDGELWALIIDDLKKSQSYLSDVNYTNTSKDYTKGRVTLGSSTAFLGQAYLFCAQLKNKPEYYQKAADEFSKVIKQQVGFYSLQYNYRDNFTETSEYNNESLFEIGYSFIGTDVWGGDGIKGVETSWQAMNAGMSSSCSAISPRWWNVAPANSILRQYEDGDSRKWMNLWCENGAYYVDLAGIHAYNPSGSLLSMNFSTNPYPKGEGGKYIGFRKYEYDYNQAQLNSQISSTSISTKYSGMSGINFRVMRYSDVLLMYAECIIAGNTSNPAGKTASECIAEIRNRANNQINPSTGDQFQYTNGNINLPYFNAVGTLSDSYSRSSDPMVQLQHERKVELFGEGKRYYDIIRWYKSNLLKDIDPDSPTFGSSISTSTALAAMLSTQTFVGKFLLPIPQYELNTNKKMIGNESN